MITIDIDGQIEARQARIDELERQLKDYAAGQIDIATEKFHTLKARVEKAKDIIGAIWIR